MTYDFTDDKTLCQAIEKAIKDGRIIIAIADLDWEFRSDHGDKFTWVHTKDEQDKIDAGLMEKKDVH